MTNFSGSSLGFVDTLCQANFLTGGTPHAPSLEVFVVATSIAASRAKPLPRWISRLGIVQATLTILSLASLVFFQTESLVVQCTHGAGTDRIEIPVPPTVRVRR